MKRKYLYAAVMLLVTACSNEDDLASFNEESKEYPVIIFQERDPHLPTDMSNGKSFKDAGKTRAKGTINPNDYLGYTYAIGNSVMGDPENARFSFINIKALQEDYPSYVSFHGLHKTDISIETYAGFERYETKASFSKTVDTGFKLNLGLFSIGRKKKMTETFVSHAIYEEETCMGELSIEVKENRNMLNTGVFVNKRIACDYLQPEFLERLYFSTIDDVLEGNGEFLIKDYYVGGRVSAQYITNFMWGVSQSIQEQMMEKNIGATFAWKKLSTSGEFGFGDNASEEMKETDSYKEMQLTINTIGGEGRFNVSLAPTFPKDLKPLDMTSWLNSIYDKPETQSMIGLAEGGLVPISDFMLEENFKRRVQDTHLRNLSMSKMATPAMEIARIYMRVSNGTKLYGIAPIIQTRHGDKIVLWDKGNVDMNADDAELKRNENNDVFTQKANDLYEKYKTYFACAITANPNVKYNSRMRVPLILEYKNFDMNGLKKYVNPKTDMMYIFDEESEQVLALFNDPYILRSYGMSTWVKNIPTSTDMSMRILSNFRIIGL